MIAFKYTSCEFMVILVFLQVIIFPKVWSQLLHGTFLVSSKRGPLFIHHFHHLNTNMHWWKKTICLKILLSKLLHSRKCYQNCCMAHFLFQVKEGHYLSTTLMLWWKRAIIFENVAIFYLDLFMKSHRKDKNIRKPDLIFYTDNLGNLFLIFSGSPSPKYQYMK